MLFYVAINSKISDNNIHKLMFEELKKYENKKYLKTLSYGFQVQDNYLIIDGNIDRILIRTIKQIDDIIDLVLRNFKQKFGLIVSLKLSNLFSLKNTKNILFLFKNDKLEEALIELDDLLISKKIFKDKISFEFDFSSAFKESKTIKLKTKMGLMNLKVFFIPSHNKTFTVVWKGNLNKVVNLRIHYMCETSEIFDSLHCDCQQQLNNFKQLMTNGDGMIIYAHEEGRGFGLMHKINAYYNTINMGLDTVEAMEKEVGKAENRKFDIAAEIVQKMNISSVKIWTNNPLKILPLIDRGIKVDRQDAWAASLSSEQKEYIKTKIEKMRHIKCK